MVVADALHFFDVERSAHEIARVLAPGGALALVTCELADTPFMRGVVQRMETTAPRRPRSTAAAITQISALTNVSLAPARVFHDETAVDDGTLERILRSISFIGPAMNPRRFADFHESIRALPPPAIWARTFTLHAGCRSARRVVG